MIDDNVVFHPFATKPEGHLADEEMSAEFVKTLEEYIELAKAGKLYGLVAVGVTAFNIVKTYDNAESNYWHQLNSSLSCIQYRICKHFDDANP